MALNFDWIDCDSGSFTLMPKSLSDTWHGISSDNMDEYLKLSQDWINRFQVAGKTGFFLGGDPGMILVSPRNDGSMTIIRWLFANSEEELVAFAHAGEYVTDTEPDIVVDDVELDWILFDSFAAPSDNSTRLYPVTFPANSVCIKTTHLAHGPNGAIVHTIHSEVINESTSHHTIANVEVTDIPSISNADKKRNREGRIFNDTIGDLGLAADEDVVRLFVDLNRSFPNAAAGLIQDLCASIGQSAQECGSTADDAASRVATLRACFRRLDNYPPECHAYDQATHEFSRWLNGSRSSLHTAVREITGWPNEKLAELKQVYPRNLRASRDEYNFAIEALNAPDE